MASNRTTVAPSSTRVRLVVASSVMLTFISFWRAAAIVLCDLASSAFYAGGISEQAIGAAAPWFVLGVMLFAFAIRAIYVESCLMFTRGGVYRVVKEALGGTVAKLSVSALMFDYILTGPISGVSAGQYITGLLNELLNVGLEHRLLPASLIDASHHAIQLDMNHTSAVIAAVVTIYFWWENIKGIEESSDKALRIMQATTVMVVIMLIWGIYSVMKVGVHLPPLPTPGNVHPSDEAMGIFSPNFKIFSHPWNLGKLSVLPVFGLFGILMGFGHSILAVSGEESLAQVNRDIEHPKLKNLKRAAIVIAIYSLIFTAGATFLASMLIPDSIRVTQYSDNLIAGLAMYMVGPMSLRIIFRIFVVIVGFVILAGAINTSMIGSTGVLMRVAEDGVLTDWFRKPQKKYGTSYRIVNLIFGLQMLTIIVSRGNILLIGEAYAFGVLWSFVFKALAMLVLRWKNKTQREWRVPINIKIGKYEIPVGLTSVFLVLLTMAIVNLFTKTIATFSGVIFSAIFFVIFTISEHINHRKHALSDRQMKEHFQLDHQDTISRESVDIRPGGVMVTMRDPANPFALKWVLSHTDTEEQDVVVLSARMMGAGSPEFIEAADLKFSEHEQMVFTKAISVAESFGKKVSLLVVPAGDIFAALVQAANALDIETIVSGLSTKMTAEEQSYHIGQAWEQLPEPKRQFNFYIVMPSGETKVFHLGPHAPQLCPNDIQMVHRLWLHLRRDPGMENLHHSDIITYALARLTSEHNRGEHEQLIRDLSHYIAAGEANPDAECIDPTTLPGYTANTAHK